jgi:hypothetical protein
MTGVFDRLRAWLGSVFGGGAADGDDGPDAPDPGPEADGRVVHRDDRPLETPSTMERMDPPAPTRERPDAEGETAGDTEAPTTTPETVSIPDAEAEARGDDDATTTGEPPIDDSGRPPTATEAADDRTGGSQTAEATHDSADSAFACSVCGTTIDDPSEPCPLCRSTDVVPTDGTSDAGTPTRGGRTTVSTGDDEAVDRLRDVTDEG